MKLFLSFVLVSGFAAALCAAQTQSGFVQPPTAPAAPAQNTTSANQGVATNPTGDAAGTATTPTAGVNTGATGQPATNATGGTAFNTPATGTNGTTTGGTAPLFINVSPTTITDASGQPLGTLQQLVLSPNGTVNFGLVNTAGRLVPVPFQLIVTGGGTSRGSLALNTDRSVLQTAPPVAMGQLPLLTQDEVAQQIFNHFGLRTAPGTSPLIVDTGTARGFASPGVTITGGTGGSTNGVIGSFGTNGAFGGVVTNTAAVPNNTVTNQAMNTTGGLLSPSGRTNGIVDPFVSGPGSVDRFGPRQNATPTQPPPAPGINNPGTGQPQR